MRLQSRQPLFYAALAFAAGIAVSRWTWRPPMWWLVGAAVVAAGALFFVWRAKSGARLRDLSAYALVLCALGGLGAFALHARESVPQDFSAIQSVLNAGEVVVTAHATRDALVRGGNRRHSLDVETEQIETPDGGVIATAVGLRISIYTREVYGEDDEGDAPQASAPSFTCGERLRFPVKLRSIRNFGNPGAWSRRDYMYEQGIYATGSVRADRVERLSGTRGSKLGRWQSAARRSVVTKIHALWPARHAGLLDAMLIGERSGLGHETQVDWQRTGIYHILVVSGMNVGILAGVIFWVLRRFRAGQLIATVLTIVLAAGYAWLADFGAPVTRGVIMLSIYLVARLLYRDAAHLNTIGLAALVLLAADPKALFEPSFQLTFVSVVAITGIALPLIGRTSRPYSRGLRFIRSQAFDLSLPPRVAQFRLDLRLVGERLDSALRLPKKLRGSSLSLLTRTAGFAIAAYDLLLVSVVAQLALTLPMVWYFHRATLLALPANLVAVPLTGILMPASLLALTLGYVWAPMAKPAALVAGWALEFISITVRFFGASSLSEVRLPNPSQLVILIAIAGILCALVLVRRRAVLAWAGVVALAASAVAVVAVKPEPHIRANALEMTSIDVGQAESSLLVTPEGRTVLVDAAGSGGPFATDFDFGEEVVSPYLWARQISRLDAVVITHAHSDHMGGMRSVIVNFRPRELWVGPNSPSRDLDELLAFARSRGVDVIQRRAPEAWTLGGARFEVMAPEPNWVPRPRHRNDDSLVLRVTYGSTSALLEADAEKAAERYLAVRNVRANVLKVAHNGSKTSTEPELLAAVSPEYAVISVGAHNSFGHPRPEILERLADANVQTYRTDFAGATSFYLDGERVTVSPWSRR